MVGCTLEIIDDIRQIALGVVGIFRDLLDHSAQSVCDAGSAAERIVGEGGGHRPREARQLVPSVPIVRRRSAVRRWSPGIDRSASCVGRSSAAGEPAAVRHGVERIEVRAVEEYLDRGDPPVPSLAVLERHAEAGDLRPSSEVRRHRRQRGGVDRQAAVIVELPVDEADGMAAGHHVAVAAKQIVVHPGRIVRREDQRVIVDHLNQEVDQDGIRREPVRWQAGIEPVGTTCRRREWLNCLCHPC